MDSKKHIGISNKGDQLLKGGKITWQRTEGEVWSDLEARLDDTHQARSISLKSRITRYSIAASVAILLALGIIASLYQIEINTLSAEHKEHILPDGSSVSLNAETKISYYPYRWKVQRRLEVEGEAFFRVEKGKEFQVVSQTGTTSVLGTSFNIYARNNDYRVSCITGRVQVFTNSDSGVILNQNEHVELSDGKLEIKMAYNVNRAISWRNGKFDFAGRPLKEVFAEIERQYGVSIELPDYLSYRNFGGSFSKSGSVEEVLEFVCKSMRLTFIKQSEDVFLIDKNSDGEIC